MKNLSKSYWVLFFLIASAMIWFPQRTSASLPDDTGAAVRSAVYTPDAASQQGQMVLVAKDRRKWYKKRSTKIVGGSAAAGALIGGLAGGGKGAAAGAAIGGGAGYVYHRKTRNKHRRY